MERAYIYARYSSDKQTEASIDAQVRACREYAAAHDMEIVRVFADEAISGSGAATKKRAQYQEMLREARKKTVSVILIHQYDRVARNLQEHVNLEVRLSELDIRLVSVAQDVGSGSTSKIVKALLWSLSEYYLDNLGVEARKGLRETALKGLHNGGVAPFGYDIMDQHYVINELEAHYVRSLFEAVAARRGVREVIASMRAAGLTGHRGREITYSSVYEMLRNEKYCGVYAYSVTEEADRELRRSKPNAIRVEGAVPPIVSRELWEKVQEIMKGRKQVGTKTEYLCSGLVWCSCGAKMHANKSTRKGHTYLRYYCSEKCGAHGIDVEEVDAAARAYLRSLLSPENQEAIAEAMRSYEDASGNRMKEFRAALRQRISERRRERENLLKNLTASVLPASAVEAIGQRIAELEAEISALENTEPPEDLTGDIVHTWLEDIKKAPDEQAIRLLIERIETSPSDDKKSTTVSCIYSTLSTVVGKTGCGGSQHILPTILFEYKL